MNNLEKQISTQISSQTIEHFRQVFSYTDKHVCYPGCIQVREQVWDRILDLVHDQVRDQIVNQSQE
jgi:hypothetical protein